MGVQIVEHIEIIQELFHEHPKIVLESYTHYSLISCWNILSLNDMTTQKKVPQLMMNAILYLSSGAIMIW
jgi:hypothetical protein